MSAVEPGITERRGRFRAEAYDKEAGRRVYKTFDRKTDARNWRRDMQVKIARGEAHAAVPTTVREAWNQWLPAARSGVVRSRGGSEYKPGVIRTYELAFEGRLLTRFGGVKVADLSRIRIQRYVDQLVAEGLAAQTVRNLVTALRVLLKWCVRQELIRSNPCDGLDLPSGGSVRDRIETPSGALALVQALQSPADRALMATAFFAGLRRGELMALRWSEVDLAEQTITVHRERGNYDPKTKTFGSPKSKKGARTLGIPELLVPFLAALNTDGLVFGRPSGEPFNETSIAARARPQWEELMLKPIGLHEARHTYASLMIAAGVNIKTISEWMGHSSVTITLDRYGHLLPGSAAVALGLLNDYLAKELT